MQDDATANARNALIGLYRDAFAAHGDSPAAVLWPKGRQALRFEALTRHLQGERMSVLDYGCGLAHLKPFLDQRHQGVEYHGADLVREFVDAAAAKYPDARLQCVQDHRELTQPVDHVLISGTFNIIDGRDEDDYLQQVRAALVHLFGLARCSLAVNFMTDQVDYRQRGAMHMNVAATLEWFRSRLTPRLRLDASYMPYEFTIVAFRDATIVRPDQVYRPL